MAALAETSHPPSWLVGAWRRRWIRRRGADAAASLTLAPRSAEGVRACYVQSGRAFVDVRFAMNSRLAREAEARVTDGKKAKKRRTKRTKRRERKIGKVCTKPRTMAFCGVTTVGKLGAKSTAEVLKSWTDAGLDADTSSDEGEDDDEVEVWAATLDDLGAGKGSASGGGGGSSGAGGSGSGGEPSALVSWHAVAALEIDSSAGFKGGARKAANEFRAAWEGNDLERQPTEDIGEFRPSETAANIWRETSVDGSLDEEWELLSGTGPAFALRLCAEEYAGLLCVSGGHWALALAFPLPPAEDSSEEGGRSKGAGGVVYAAGLLPSSSYAKDTAALEWLAEGALASCDRAATVANLPEAIPKSKAVGKSGALGLLQRDGTSAVSLHSIMRSVFPARISIGTTAEAAKWTLVERSLSRNTSGDEVAKARAALPVEMQ